MDVLKALRAEEMKFRKQLETIQSAIKILGGSGGNRNNSGNGRRKKHHTMSAAARARIGRATKLRWAKFRAAKRKADK
jgi:hypothetical protein